MKRIIVDNLSKKFKIGFRKRQSALARILSLFLDRETKEEINVLKNVSFSVNSGEFIGIIGENGSGKSTLLRILAGIYEKNQGSVKHYGKIVSLINLNVGMQDRLTMRENIYLCSNFFGMRRKEIRERFDLIVEFSDLKNFLDTKIYQFSEGMKQRLAFSIAINCSPEILLLDEVFDVGDESFRIKVSDKIHSLLREGVSVLLVSHDLELIKKNCSRIMWLDRGKIRAFGGKEVIEKYLKFEKNN